MARLSGKRIAALVDDGFEQVELTEPKKTFEREGATVDIVSPQDIDVKGWQHTQWGDTFHVDRPLGQARSEDYDALFLPGGVMNPDHLRMNRDAVEFTRAFVQSGKPIVAICHGPWTLIEAGGARGRRMTSWPSLKTDLKNAGAEWTDEQVVVDRGLVTSRKPDDLPAFSAAAVEEIAKDRESGQQTGVGASSARS